MGMIMHDDGPYGEGTSYTPGTGIAINNNIIAVDADNTPTAGSEKPVKSKGVYDALAPKVSKSLLKSTVGWTGKNLIPFPYGQKSRTDNGVTYTVNADNSVTVNGTATANSTFTLQYRLNPSAIKLEVGRTYKLNGGKSRQLSISISVERNGSAYYYGYDTGNGLEFTPQTGDVSFGSVIQVTNGSTVNNVTVYPMLRDASITDDTYEPYHESVEEVVEQIYADNGVLGAKNLFEFGNQNPTTFVKLKFSTPLPAGKYILSSKITTTFSGNIAQARFRKENESNLLVVSLIANTSKVESVQFQIEEPAYYVFLYASDGNTEYTCSWENIMLRLASDPDDTYVPYAMTNRELTEAIASVPSGGMLPYLYIDSEAGATVTVVQPDSTTITPTAAGSGHWECELTGGYGTYVIHSVLSGQGDATQSLAVDTVKEYHVTDTHYDYTINVTAPSGSTVRIVGGGETYTRTGTGSSQAFAVHTPSTTYTVTATQIMDGNTKTDEATVTSAATSGGSTNVTLSIEFGTINVSVAADFVTAGSTITCVNGGTSCTPKTAASTLTFRVPTTGTWTISGEISGQTYSVDANVSSLSTAVSVNLQTLPEGSTVTPTDDIQIWLNCAGIYDKTSYTTLADVLGDSTTLLALMSDNNAVDYLVRSTTWATDVCADSTAMTDIGANNYCADTLLDDADWLDAICNSTYIDSVLNVKIPTLSAASPSVTTSGDQNGYENYKAFNNQFAEVGSTNHGWLASSTGVGAYIRYEFDAAISIKKAYFAYEPYQNDVTFDLAGNDDGGSTWDIIQSNIALTSANKTRSYSFLNATPHKYYRAIVTAGNIYYGYGLKIQLYGREDV